MAEERIKMETFDAPIQKDDAGRLTFFQIPFNAKERFCKPKGTIYVSGTINGVKYRSKLLSRGDGEFLMILDKALQKAIGFDGQTMNAHITMASEELEPADGKQEEPVCGRWESGKIHYDKW